MNTTTTQPTNPNAPLATEKIEVGRKKFFIDLKENNRGRFLKITEDVAGRRDTIMVPTSVMREMADHIKRLADFNDTLPPMEEEIR